MDPLDNNVRIYQGRLLGKQAKRDKTNNKVKRDYTWKSVKPKGSEYLTLIKYDKT